ncbi:uncharacterized protein BDV14DRAFT_171065 [Aspergillus stella-maris]|uniref:uncharacterized protein n=1 Tax=Aspergillus stella-maris TaxID=1810926 RepID=UPI003CCD9A1F
MTTVMQNRPWTLKKAVLVHAPDSDFFCVARLRIVHGPSGDRDQSVVHGQAADQASISLSITAALANSNSRSHLTLIIPPDRVEKCGLARQSNDSLCSYRFLSSLPAPVTNASDVSTLTLSLDTVGMVLCPSGTESLIPATPGDLQFQSFAKICQSKFLRLHFSNRQFVNNELDKLQNFTQELRQGSLQAVPFNHARHGLLQTDWRIFALAPDPPPYSQAPVSEQEDPPVYHEQVVGKRRREPRSVSPNDEGRKRLLPPSPQPIGSPTEMNTPSTRGPSYSPSIRPTAFQRASPVPTEYEKLARLENQLRSASDDLIRKLLIRTGREHLLAPANVERPLSNELSKVDSLKEVEMMMMLLERRLERYVDKSVEHQLAGHVDRAVSECRDQAYDAYTQKEAEFHEQIEDANVEVRDTTNECMDELQEQVQGYMVQTEDQAQRHIAQIEDQAQRYMAQIQEQAKQCIKDIEDRRIEIAIDSEISGKTRHGPRPNPSAQSSLDEKPNSRLGPGIRTRCSSV